MKHKGFTLVEIALFLAVTGALFVGIIAGTQNSIRLQRYNDSVQSFANFWRDIYASVSNTQNLGDGRSDQAIYGKLVVFGEACNFDGGSANFSSCGTKPASTGGQTIFTYDVIGGIAKPGTNVSNNTLEALAELQTNILVVERNGSEVEVYPSGFIDSYTPTWGATIEKPSIQYANDKWPFTGSILVVKHPRSTTIGTYFSSKIIEVNHAMTENPNAAETILKDVLELAGTDPSAFEPKEVDFCINSDDIGQARFRRQDIRLVKNANNVSGVEILSADSPNNPCTNSEAGT